MINIIPDGEFTGIIFTEIQALGTINADNGLINRYRNPSSNTFGIIKVSGA